MIAHRLASSFWVVSFAVCLAAAGACSSSSSSPSGSGSSSSGGSSGGSGGAGLHCVSLNKSGAEGYCEAYASGPETCNGNGGGDGGQRLQLASCFPPATMDTPVACCIDSQAAYICYYSAYLSGSTITQITQSGCTGGGGKWIDPATQASLPF